MCKIILILASLATSDLFARYLKKDDFTYIVKEHKKEVRIYKDDHRQIHIKLKYQVVKENGKKQLSSHAITYNRASAKIKIVKASVTNGKTTIEVASKNIVDTPIMARSHGFDARNIVKIALPQVRIGSIVDIEYIKTENKPLFKGHFSMFEPFGLGQYEDLKHIKIIADKKIYYELNDPNKIVYVQSKSNKQGQFVLTAKLKRPFGNIDAISALQVNPKKLTFLLVSTDKDWYKVAENLRLSYEKVINGKLPPTLEKIAQEISKKEKLVDKVNHGVSRIIQEYNYLGDWRTIEGQLIPKGFNELEKTKYGDCKDFSSALTAVLRKTNIDAYVAWVYRGHLVMRKKYDSNLVFSGGFNHAIVHIRDSGKEFWVDPTHQYANGFTINDDIALSEAFVLEPKGPGLRQLPPPNEQDHHVRIRQAYSFKNLKKANVIGQIQLSGRYSAEFIGAERKMSKAKIEENILSLVSIGENKTLPEVSSFSLNGIINRRLNFSLRYTAKDMIQKNLNQNFIVVPSNNIFKLASKGTTNRITDIFLGEPYTLTRKLIFKNIHFAGKKLPACDISTKWLSLNRRIQEAPGSIIYHEEFKLKKPVVSQSEFESTDYKMLVFNLISCRNQSALAVALGERKGQGRGVSHWQKLSKLFKQLPLKKRVLKRHEIANQVVNNRGKNVVFEYNMSDALSLVKLNLQEDPHHEKSYLMMARIIRMRGNYNSNNYSSSSLAQAEAVIDRGILRLGRTPMLLLRKSRINYLATKDKALALKFIEEANKVEKDRDVLFLKSLAYSYDVLNEDKKFLAVVKEWKNRAGNKKLPPEYYFNLAAFYAKNKNWKKCIKHYESYLKKVTNSRFAYHNVGICYRASKQYDKAISSHKRAIASVSFGAAEHGLVLSYISKGHQLILEKKISQAKATLNKAP